MKLKLELLFDLQVLLQDALRLVDVDVGLLLELVEAVQAVVLNAFRSVLTVVPLLRLQPSPAPVADEQPAVANLPPSFLKQKFVALRAARSFLHWRLLPVSNLLVLFLRKHEVHFLVSL
jgi:hypothetical protein